MRRTAKWSIARLERSRRRRRRQGGGAPGSWIATFKPRGCVSSALLFGIESRWLAEGTRPSSWTSATLLSVAGGVMSKMERRAMESE